MKAWQIVAIVVGVLVLLAAGTCGGLYFWVTSHEGELREEGKRALREGTEFGTGKDATACLTEALQRLPKESGPLGDVLGEALNKSFFDACLKVAVVPPGTCEGIPPRNEIMKSAAWAVTRCGAEGRASDQACTRLIGALQARCAAP